MKNKRINRISEEVRRVVSDLILNGLKDPRISKMASVTSVEVTRDLSFANIYISVLGNDLEKENTILGLESAKGYIRNEIGNRIDLRHVPEPIFHLDETIENAMYMSELIDKVAKKEKDTRGNGNE
ncbi:MAG: 30S ribosome-binding factor RbfA [Tissierellaceae bacterium]|jgi:ribosome-binding factor A|nr:30S ribosome-binding factor RbfA [Tissierellia bacterium]